MKFTIKKTKTDLLQSKNKEKGLQLIMNYFGSNLSINNILRELPFEEKIEVGYVYMEMYPELKQTITHYLLSQMESFNENHIEKIFKCLENEDKFKYYMNYYYDEKMAQALLDTIELNKELLLKFLENKRTIDNSDGLKLYNALLKLDEEINLDFKSFINKFPKIKKTNLTKLGTFFGYDINNLSEEEVELYLERPNINYDTNFEILIQNIETVKKIKGIDLKIMNMPTFALNDNLYNFYKDSGIDIVSLEILIKSINNKQNKYNKNLFQYIQKNFKYELLTDDEKVNLIKRLNAKKPVVFNRVIKLIDINHKVYEDTKGFLYSSFADKMEIKYKKFLALEKKLNKVNTPKKIRNKKTTV